jgi:predicted DNA-binding transcriptional regulator YafY
MTKAERLIYILSLLRSHRFLKAHDLAVKCGVCERTIYRDIISISGSHIPIYFENGYKLIHQEFLPPMNFTPTEADYLIRLLSSESPYGVEGTNRLAETIVEKLRVASNIELVC